MTFDPLFWLNQNNYRTYNIIVARKLGDVSAAILLSELVGKHNYYKEKKDVKLVWDKATKIVSKYDEKELLGKVSSENGRVIRFRLVAEDKNRKSAWSQIFLVVDSQTVDELPGDIEVVNNTVFVNWFNSSNQ